jgi:hypothetical protein
MIEPGSVIRLKVPKVGFYPSDHPLHTTHHGPLIHRGAALSYVGPDPEPRRRLHRPHATTGRASATGWSTSARRS